jgi:hypothetical protein
MDVLGSQDDIELAVHVNDGALAKRTCGDLHVIIPQVYMGRPKRGIGADLTHQGALRQSPVRGRYAQSLFRSRP